MTNYPVTNDVQLVLVRTYNREDDDQIVSEDYDVDDYDYVGPVTVEALTDACDTWVSTRKSDDGYLPSGEWSVEARDRSNGHVVAESGTITVDSE